VVEVFEGEEEKAAEEVVDMAATTKIDDAAAKAEERKISGRKKSNDIGGIRMKMRNKRADGITKLLPHSETIPETISF